MGPPHRNHLEVMTCAPGDPLAEIELIGVTGGIGLSGQETSERDSDAVSIEIRGEDLGNESSRSFFSIHGSSSRVEGNRPARSAQLIQHGDALAEHQISAHEVSYCAGDRSLPRGSVGPWVVHHAHQASDQCPQRDASRGGADELDAQLGGVCPTQGKPGGSGPQCG